MENDQKIYNSEAIMQEMEKKDIRKKSFMGGLLSGLLIAMCITLAVVIYNGIENKNSKSQAKSDNGILTSEVEKKIGLIEDAINKYYLNEVDEKDLEEGLYRGLLASLGDPYSTYYSVEELEQVEQSTQGIYYGIGAYIALDEETGGGRITKVMENTPAMEAGVKDEDIITKVDGENIIGLTLQDIIAKVKGPEDTQVMLTMYREGESDYIDIEVTRKKIESPTVIYEMKEDSIAYIQITEFDSVTTDQFKEKLAMAKNDGMRGLVLDVRSNPGGNLADVVAICQQILPKGMIVYTENKDGKRNEYTCDGKNEIQVPMVVLVNGYSASAAEILAGAIKDHNKGTILGTTTYGKGIVQKIFGVTDGSALKLTISNYYTPNGNNIHGIGIEPDEELEFDGELYKNDGRDNQLERAIEILKEE